MLLSKVICHLITRFQLQTKGEVFRSVLKTPDIFICQHYFLRNFLNYQVKTKKTKQNKTAKTKEGINVVLTFKRKVIKNQVITALGAVTDAQIKQSHRDL